MSSDDVASLCAHASVILYTSISSLLYVIYVYLYIYTRISVRIARILVLYSFYDVLLLFLLTDRWRWRVTASLSKFFFLHVCVIWSQWETHKIIWNHKNPVTKAFKKNWFASKITKLVVELYTLYIYIYNLIFRFWYWTTIVIVLYMHQMRKREKNLVFLKTCRCGYGSRVQTSAEVHAVNHYHAVYYILTLARVRRGK